MGRGRRRQGPRDRRDRRPRPPRADRGPHAGRTGRTGRAGRNALLAGVLAVPVGLGTAAALVLVTSAGPELTSQADAPGAGASAGADNGLPPAADDFFDDSGDGSDAQGGTQDGSQGDREGSSGTGGAADGAASGKDSLSASEEPTDDGGGDREDDADSSEDSGGSGGSDGSGGSGGPGGGVSAQGGGSSVVRDVVALANDERADAGCGPLEVDSKLTNASQKHSRDMARRDYMAHDTPEGIGPAERAAEAGYSAWGGENVAAGYGSAESVMDGWMNSEGHRANILNCDFVSIGVGETDGYWAQNFGYA